MSFEKQYDLVCIGGGIMSANLALLTKLLNPDKKILILERLDAPAKESSAAWNNAGTGHSALCELNYTPEKEDGSIDITKAVSICKQFEISKQLWCYLVENKLIDNPSEFVMPVKHHSWVLGKDNADYLEKRYEAFKNHFMFDTIEFTRETSKMKQWFPLITEDRDDSEIMAASRIDRGTEVNFGVLTEKLLNVLASKFDTPVHNNNEVYNVNKTSTGWSLQFKNLNSNKKHKVNADKIFIGSGGASLLLLQKLGIKEGKGYGGFPVGGQWLVCNNPEIIAKHDAKVYSKAGIGDPPMSTPHLDTRYIDGKRSLLFGPFAGFSPKFLKKGSNLDLIKSIKFSNMIPMLQVFFDNFGLTKYLVKQVLMSKDGKVESLKKFIKNADPKDWDVMIAGQRVQIIKKNAQGKGILQFGTEVIANEQGSVTCLLGASPGASTATAIMLDVLAKTYPELANSPKLKEIIPFYKAELNENLFKSELARVKEILSL